TTRCCTPSIAPGTDTWSTSGSAAATQTCPSTSSWPASPSSTGRWTTTPRPTTATPTRRSDPEPRSTPRVPRSRGRRRRTPLAHPRGVGGLVRERSGRRHGGHLLVGEVAHRPGPHRGAVGADLAPLADGPGVELHGDDGVAAQAAALLHHPASGPVAALAP